MNKSLLNRISKFLNRSKSSKISDKKPIELELYNYETTLLKLYRSSIDEYIKSIIDKISNNDEELNDYYYDELFVSKGNLKEKNQIYLKNKKTFDSIYKKVEHQLKNNLNKIRSTWEECINYLEINNDILTSEHHEILLRLKKNVLLSDKKLINDILCFSILIGKSNISYDDSVSNYLIYHYEAQSPILYLLYDFS